MYQYTGSIVLYNSPVETVKSAIQSFFNSTGDNKLLILIDHSPQDNLKVLTDIFNTPQITYYHHPENRGYGAGHNIAIQKIWDLSPIHYVINPDIIFDSNVISYLNDIHIKNKDVGLLMPQIRNPKGEIQYLAKLIPTPLDVIGKRFLPTAWMKSRLERYQLMSTSYQHVMNVPYLSGAFMSIKVDALKTVGLFDERFFMYPEDIDLSRRIHEHYKTLYIPQVFVTHIHEAASYKNYKMLWIHMTNMIKYFNKWGWIWDKKRKKINRQVWEAVKNL